jgi:lysophospholipase L1-like esterase
MNASTTHFRSLNVVGLCGRIVVVLLTLTTLALAVVDADFAGGGGAQPLVVTVSAHGDSLTSCNGVTPSQAFAFLSYREHLWKDYLMPWVAAHRSSSLGASASASMSPRISVVGRKRGCNHILDARFDRSNSFPNRHDSYFGRSAEAMLTEWTEFVSSPTPSRNAVVGDVALLLIGTNDFLLHGKANATDVAHNIGRIVRLMLNAGGGNHHERHILIGSPPDLDLTRVKLSWRRAARWKEYIASLHSALKSLASNDDGYTYCRRSISLVKSGEGGGDEGVGMRSRCELVVFSPEWEPKQHTYDGIHPNHDGEKLMARHWAKALLPHLERKWMIAAANKGGVLLLPPQSTVVTSAVHMTSESSPATPVTPRRDQFDNSMMIAWAALVLMLVFLSKGTCVRQWLKR